MVLEYKECATHPPNAKPSQTTTLDIPSLLQAGFIRHVFATSGARAKPVQLDVNGRKGRRAVCVLYEDAVRYDVFDLDDAMEGDEEDGNGEDEVEVEGST